MPSEILSVRSHDRLQTSGAIRSESGELNLLRLENRQLRMLVIRQNRELRLLVIRLSRIVFKNMMERKRVTSDSSAIESSKPSLCSPNSAPSFWFSS